jgi:chemotaxis protein histidine kinase CheA
VAVFEVKLETGAAQRSADDLASSVKGLSDEFEAYQQQLQLVKEMQEAAFARSAQEQAAIAKEQAAAFAFHGKNAYKGDSEKDRMSSVRAEQAANLDAYAAASEAAYGQEKAMLADIAAEQKQMLALHDARVAREQAMLSEIKKQQAANLAKHDQDRDAAEGLRKQQEEAAETSKWFEELTASNSNFEDQLFAFSDTLTGAVVPAVEAAIAVLAVYGTVLKQAMAMAIALTQEKDQIESVFDVFTGGAGGSLLDELEDLSAELPFTADKLNDWGKGLLAAGIQGDQLRTSIRAVAAAQAIMGSSGASAAEGLIKRFAMMAESGQKVSLDRRILTQLAAAGVSVQALAKELKTTPEQLGKMKLGAKELGDAMQRALIAQGAGPLEKLGMTWDSISAKVTEGFEDAFEDLDDLVHPFMQEIQSFAAEFFAGSVASQGFAGVVKGVLAPAFEVATKFVRFLHHNFLALQIAFLQVRVWLLPITNALGVLDGKAVAVTVALYLLKGTCIVLAVVFGLLGTAVALLVLPFVVIGLAIYGVYLAISALIDLIGAAIDNCDNLKGAAANAGAELINGLGGAILSGSAWIVGLITNLALSMVGAIKTTLGIRSPSRVFMGLGQQTTAGFVAGIDSGAPAVQASAQGAGMAAITGASQGAAQAGATGAKAGSGRTVKIRIEKGAIQINGAGDVLALTEEALAQILERLAVQAGLGVPQGA